MDERDEAGRVTVGDLWGRALHLANVGQFDRARELASSLVADNPGNPTAFLVLSQTLLAVGDSEAALVAADSAGRLDPENDVVHGLRAQALRRLGRFRESEEAFLDAVRLDPADGAYHLGLAQLRAACGRPKAALPCVKRALELDPDDQNAHTLMADLLITLSPGQLDLSEEAAKRALALDPEDSEAHAVIGLLRLRQRDLDGAEESFRTALELYPGNRVAQRGLAEALMARSWVYRPFLAFAIAMSRASTAQQLVIVASVWAVVNALSLAMARGALRDVLNFAYLGLCAYTWFSRPIMMWILGTRYPWMRSLDG